MKGAGIQQLGAKKQQREDRHMQLFQFNKSADALSLLGSSMHKEEMENKLTARADCQPFSYSRKAGAAEALFTMIVRPAIVQVKSKEGERLALAYMSALQALAYFGVQVPLEERPAGALWKWPAEVRGRKPKAGVDIALAMSTHDEYKTRLESPEETTQPQAVLDVLDMVIPDQGKPNSRQWELPHSLVTSYKWDDIFLLRVYLVRGADGQVLTQWEAVAPQLSRADGTVVQKEEVKARGTEMPPLRNVRPDQISAATLKLVHLRREDGVDVQNLLVWSYAFGRGFHPAGDDARDTPARIVQGHITRWMGRRLTGIPQIDVVLERFKRAAAARFAQDQHARTPWVEAAIRDACGINAAGPRFQRRLRERELQELSASLLEAPENLAFWPLLAYYHAPELPGAGVPASVNNWLLAAAGDNPWSLERKLGDLASLRPTPIYDDVEGEEETLVADEAASAQTESPAMAALVEESIPVNALMSADGPVGADQPEKDPYAGLSDEELDALTSPDARDGFDALTEAAAASELQHVDVSVASLVAELRTGGSESDVEEELADVPRDSQ